MGMNISAALGGDPAMWPTIWRVTGAVLGDVAAACLPFAVLRAHRNGALLTAAFLALIWAGGCAYTVYSATEWNISQAAAIRDPIAQAKWKEATAKGTYEQQIKIALGNLMRANDQALTGKTQLIRSDAMATAQSAQAELARLNANPPAMPQELRGAVNQAFSDWPWFWPVMLLVFSQAGWAVLAVAQNGAGAPASPVPPARGSYEQGEHDYGRPVSSRRAPAPRTNKKTAEIITFIPKGAELDGQVSTMREQGCSQVLIAQQLGISRATVQRIIKRLASASVSRQAQ